MALPKIATPEHEIILPISKQKVLFRPFLVKEQKLLLMANEEKSEEIIYNTIKQIIKNCCLSDNLEIDSLSVVDVEFFFLHLRAKSVGEVVETKYRCENFAPGMAEPCGNIMEISYDITDVDVNINDYKDELKLTDSIGVKMKFPTYELLKMDISDKDENLIFSIIKGCMEYIYDMEEIYYIKDTPDKELDEFIDSLSVDQLNIIKEYFNNLPSIKKTVKTVCSKCGFNHEINIKGVSNFFE